MIHLQLLLQDDLASQQVEGAWDPTPSRLDIAIPFLPALFLLAYTLLILSSRYLIPRFIKEKLAFLTRDPVTIDDIPDAEPVFRRLPLRKIIVNILACFARLGVEIYLLVEACLSRNRTPKVEVVLYSFYVALWVGTILRVRSWALSHNLF